MNDKSQRSPVKARHGALGTTFQFSLCFALLLTRHILIYLYIISVLFPHELGFHMAFDLSTIDMSVRNPTCKECICLQEVNILKALSPALSNTKRRKVFLPETNIDMMVQRKDV